MRIVILSDYETQSGGAAISASRLADGLLDCGQQVARIVSYPDGKKHRWDTFTLAPSFLAWMGLRRLPTSLGQLYSNREAHRRLAQLLKTIQPDVINVHNLHGALNNGWSADLLMTCQEHAPVVWTLHDMWSFTGRCAYSFDCEKFLTGCDETCPTPYEYPSLPPSEIAKSWGERAILFRDSTRLIAVTPSNWLAAIARAGFWHDIRVETIPIGLPLDVYAPLEKSLARRALGLDTRGPALLLAGLSLAERRKGVEIALEAIRKIRQRPITLLFLGADPPQIEIPDIWVQNLGYINHERTKALVYNSADLFIHPALADNLPSTVLEAIACGTPVVAFDVGGVPELVRPGKSGWLASSTDAECLAETIDIALQEIASSVGLSDTCRRLALAEFSFDLQVQRYLELFQALK